MFIKEVSILLLVLLSTSAFAFNSGLTYHGRILKPDNSPETDSAVQFKIQIRSPGNENCLMYEEQQTKDLSVSQGSFAISLNDGSGTRTDTSGYSLDQIFGNRIAMTFSFGGGNCAIGTSYIPASTDNRKIAVQFKDSTMSSWEPLPAQAINFTPSAIEAYQVGGFPSSTLFRVENPAGPQNITSLTLAQANVLVNLAQGTTQYVTTTANGAALPSFASDPSTPVAGDVWYDSTNKVVKYYDGTSVQVVGSGGAVSANSITSGTIGGSTSMNTTGSITATTVSATTDATQNLQIYNTGNTHKVTVTVPASLAADYPLQLPGALPATNGLVLSSTTAGVTSWAQAYTNGGNSWAGPATLGTNDNNTLAFKTNNATAMTIDTSGNVGIGTATPADKLDVNGSVGIIGSVNAGNGIVDSSNTANTYASSSSSNQSPDPSGGAQIISMNTLGLDNNGAYYNFSVKNGIGKTQQAYMAAVAQTGAVDTPVIVIGQSTGTAAYQERVRIDTNGNVGIGTTTPAAMLDVYGTIDIKGLNAISFPVSDTTSGGSIAIGPAALSSLSGTPAAFSNTALGYQAGKADTTGMSMTAVGYQALAAATTGDYATAFGYKAAAAFTAPAATQGSSPVAIGANALSSLTTGSYNTGVGSSALSSLTTGGQNTAVGFAAGSFKTSGSGGNVAFGYAALYGAIPGQSSGNTSVGTFSMFQNTTGNSNTSVGYGAGYDITSGASNIMIGSYPTNAVGITTGSNNIMMGYDIRPPSQTASNQMNIGNLIYATGLGSGTTASTGNVGIGTTTPAGNLAIDNAGHNATLCLNGTCTTTLSGGGGGSQSSTSNFVLNSNSDGTGSDGGFNFQSNGSNILQVSNSGAITTYGNITGNSALAVAAGGTNQNLGLASSGTGAVNVGTGNGTGLSVLDPGAASANYITVKGASTGNAPVLGTAGSDTNINLVLTPKGTGNVGIGTAVPTKSLSLTGQSAQTIWMERESTAATAGNDLTIQAGGAKSGGSNLNGGNLYLSAGTSTGGGQSNIFLQTSANGAGATTDATPLNVVSIFGNTASNTPAVEVGFYPYGVPAGSAETLGVWTKSSGATGTGTGEGLLVNNSYGDPSGGRLVLAHNSSGGDSPLNVNDETGVIDFVGFDTGFSGFASGEIRSITTNVTSGSTAGKLIFATRNNNALTDQMAILANGNVGIGTTTPGFALEVKKDTGAATGIEPVASFSRGAGNLQGVDIGYSGLGGAIDVGGAISAHVSGAPLYFYIGGTTLPILSLASAANTFQQVLMVNANSTLSALSVTQAGTGNGFDVSTGGSNRLTVVNSGNVGIGTTTPAGNLAIDNAGHNATLCLNGTCSTTLGGGSVGNYSFSSNTMTTAAGDPMTIVPGAASTATSAGNSVTINGGPGGSTSGSGGSVTVSGGTPTAGAGGSVNITGAAGVGTNQNGGNVVLTPGAATGSGTPGAVQVSGQIYTPRYALTYGASITVNWANSNIQSIVLTGNSTLTFAGGLDGARYTLIVQQDATGSRTITWPGNVRFPGGTPVTLTTTANKTDYIGFIYNGISNTYDGVSISQNY